MQNNKKYEKHLNTFLTNIGFEDIIGDPNLDFIAIELDKIREINQEIDKEFFEMNKHNFIEGVDY